MPRLVRAFPIVGSIAEVERFFADMRDAKASEVDAFYRRYGVSEERVYLEEIEPGKRILIVVTTISDAPEAGARYGAAAGEFEIWFKERIRSLTGVDPNAQPLGPPAEEVFVWRTRRARARS